MELDNEVRIRKKKDKKLLQHFEGTINDVKIRFLKFRFKTRSIQGETVDLIEIISKVKFHELDKENALLRLENEKSIVEIIGDWEYGWSGPGEYGVSYSIKRKNEHDKS